MALPFASSTRFSKLQTRAWNSGSSNASRVTVRCCEATKEPPRPNSKLQVGSPIIIVEAPKVIKTAASMPCLRANAGLVKPGDVGRIVSRKPKDLWAVRLSIGTYLLDVKIKTFSQLEKSTSTTGGKYESRLFSNGGYNWRMIIYPKGNDKDYGSDFISMYVEIDSTSLMSRPPSEVFADLRFFIYNRKENKYFTMQDSKSFNTLRTVQGISQVLPLDKFNDPENGYIFGGDECEFGVDVIVAPPPTNWEILSFNDKLTYPKFSWSLKNFSILKANVYLSSSFSMGGRNWNLKLYPKGTESTDPYGKWVSIFLCLASSETLKEGEKIFARAHVRVLDPYGENHVTNEFEYWHIRPSLGWGDPQFVSLAEVTKAYLDKEGSLNVEIEFEVVSQTKYSL